MKVKTVNLQNHKGKYSMKEISVELTLFQVPAVDCYLQDERLKK